MRVCSPTTSSPSIPSTSLQLSRRFPLISDPEAQKFFFLLMLSLSDLSLDRPFPQPLYILFLFSFPWSRTLLLQSHRAFFPPGFPPRLVLQTTSDHDGVRREIPPLPFFSTTGLPGPPSCPLKFFFFSVLPYEIGLLRLGGRFASPTSALMSPHHLPPALFLDRLRITSRLPCMAVLFFGNSFDAEYDPRYSFFSVFLAPVVAIEFHALMRLSFFPLRDAYTARPRRAAYPVSHFLEGPFPEANVGTLVFCFPFTTTLDRPKRDRRSLHA